MWMAQSLLEGLAAQGFDGRPLSVLRDEQTHDLGMISALALLENGPPLPRQQWQRTQLNHLLRFARQHSAFWRGRLGEGEHDESSLGQLPALSREQLAGQVRTEGPLSRHVPELATRQMASYASSGSTGVPVQTHSLQHNARFNELRSLAQYFFEGRRLDLPRTFIKPAGGQQLADGVGIRVEMRPSWLGSLSGLFAAGHYKIIHAGFDIAAIAQALRPHPVGYLACLGSHMEALVQLLGDDISKLGIHMWVHHSDDMNPSVVAFLADRGIVTRSSYSCSELGPIAVQCEQSPAHYHVVHSNVIVQGEPLGATAPGEGEISNLLLTHLHSYATPLVRYEVGDCAVIHERCPCGHSGRTLSAIRGRRKNFVRAVDGTWVLLPIFSKPLNDIVGFSEFFLEQTEPGRVRVWLVPTQPVSTQDCDRLTRFLRAITREDLLFEIEVTERIDWSGNPKRVPFISRL